MSIDVPRELTPPRGLEDRTVNALKRQGLLRPSGGRAHGWWRQAVAAVLLFAIGAAAGVMWDNAKAMIATSQPRFLLLLQDGPPLSPQQESRVVADYRAWAARLREEGRYVTGERLASEAVAVPDVALPRADAIEGYFIVSAADLGEAVAVARTSPHVRHGGHVVVRPIDTPASR